MACALLASLPLCLSESASGLSHVVKVSKHRNKYKDKYNDKHEYKDKIQNMLCRLAGMADRLCTSPSTARATVARAWGGR